MLCIKTKVDTPSNEQLVVATIVSHLPEVWPEITEENWDIFWQGMLEENWFLLTDNSTGETLPFGEFVREHPEFTVEEDYKKKFLGAVVWHGMRGI